MNYSDVFSKMSESEFNAWLAGFFDGEGCIYFPLRMGVVEMSTASTNREVIYAVKRKIGCGSIQITRYKNKKHNTKYAWRVRRYEDVWSVLLRIGPYLTIKSTVAQRAIERINGKREYMATRHARNTDILTMFLSGKSRTEVANIMKMKQANVNVIILSALQGRSIGRTKPTPIPEHLLSAASRVVIKRH